MKAPSLRVLSFCLTKLDGIRTQRKNAPVERFEAVTEGFRGAQPILGMDVRRGRQERIPIRQPNKNPRSQECGFLFVLFIFHYSSFIVHSSHTRIL